MNKKVFVSMLILTTSFLVGLYFAKLVFPQQFVMCVENNVLVTIGNFVDSHVWLRYICASITSFITYWLFLCACKGKLYLNWKECLIVLAFIIGLRIINFFDTSITTHLSISSFFIIPLICKFDLKRASIIYAVHGLSQVLSLGIRSLPIYLTQVNYLTVLVLTLECYFWLLLFYIIFNYKKKEGKV